MKIGCVILAGGKSSRMGKDKALLEFDGTNFIEKIAGELSFFEEKMIARGNNSELLKLQHCSWKIIPDVYPDHGPIGGIHAALKECKSEAMFCVSCDVPLITSELAEKMCNMFSAQDATGEACDAVIAVTVDGKYHPLCGIYRKELWRIFEEQIIQDQNKIMNVLKKCNTFYVNLNDETSKQLMNINTKIEYKNLRK